MVSSGARGHDAEGAQSIRLKKKPKTETPQLEPKPASLKEGRPGWLAGTQPCTGLGTSCPAWQVTESAGTLDHLHIYIKATPNAGAFPWS